MIEREMKKQISLLPSPPVTSHPVKLLPVPDESITQKQVSRSEKILISENEIYAALQLIKDPEIDINVIDLGLIQDVRIDQQGITVTMILTTRFCPYQGSIIKSIEEAVKKISGQGTVNIIVDYTKTWSRSDLTEAGKKQWDHFFKTEENNN